MANDIIVIFGATGQQGYSILTTIASHPALSQRYSVRGITRDASKPKPQYLITEGIEIIQANLDDPSTLPVAVKDAHTVILITETQYAFDLKECETRQAKNAANAAVAAGVQFFVFSTAVHCSALWDGPAVDQFDVKAEIQTYLRTLPFKLGSAYIAPGMFMQNLVTVMKPRLKEDGGYVIAGVNDPDTKIPLIDAAGDSGAYLVPILEYPEMFNGEVVYAASGVWSFGEIANIISNVSGEKVVYRQLPGDVFAGFMPQEMGGRMVAMMSFFDGPGYFGAGTEGKVSAARELVRRTGGKLTSFEEFAETNCSSL